jgi:hypothetical protein
MRTRKRSRRRARRSRIPSQSWDAPDILDDDDDESEFEDELEAEGELEWEDELEDEYEDEDEYEGEYEDESEAEAEAFFGGLLNLVRKGLSSPTLRKVGSAAAKSALDALGGMLSGDGESEFEDEDLLSPIRRIYPDALMEHLGHAAAEAESEDEASAAFAPLVSLAASKILPAAEYMAAKHGTPKVAKAAPHIAHAVMKVSPHLTKGVKQIARTLHRTQTARPLIRTIPHIVRKVTAHLAKKAAQGHPITRKAAVQTLARHAAHVLGNPRQSVHAYQQSKKLDQRYHGPRYWLKGGHGAGHLGHHRAHWGAGGRPASGAHRVPAPPPGYRGYWGPGVAGVVRPHIHGAGPCPTCGKGASPVGAVYPTRRRFICSQCRAVF